MMTSLKYFRRSAAVGTIILGVSVLPVTLCAQNSTAEAAYERAAKAYASFKTVDAQFEQKITNSLLGKTAVSEGRFLQQRPNLVSINFTDPAGDRIVGDGKSLWVYLPSSTPGQVLKLPANADGAILVNLFGQLLDAPSQSMTITGGDAATVEGASTRRVQLVPKVSGSVPFQRATLWIDDQEARVRRVQVIDAQGVDRTFTMRTWVTNSTLPKDTFRFSAPKGVKTVTALR